MGMMNTAIVTFVLKMKEIVMLMMSVKIVLDVDQTSDVTGLKFPGFGRAGPNFFGPRAGPGFLMSGFGRALGLFPKI